MDATNIKKTKKKNKAGQLTQYKVTGIPEEVGEKVDLACIQFIYNKKGKLTKKEANYHLLLYGTSESYYYYSYNKYKQPIYKYSYLTHGHSETYYSYASKKSAIPKYEVYLDYIGDLVDGTLYLKSGK